MNQMENPRLVRQMTVCLSLFALICLTLIFRFTTKSEFELERVRALVILETIHNLQGSYFQEYGTYLASGGGKTSDVLQWDDVPGQFQYFVIDHGNTYVALAEADLDGDGILEIWGADPEHPEPVLVQED